MQIDKKIYDEINEYCKLNDLKTRDFIHNLLKEAFLKEKYGDKPFFFNEYSVVSEETNDEKEVLPLIDEIVEQKSVEDVQKIEQVLKVAEQTIDFNIVPVEPGEIITIQPEKQKIKRKRTLK